MDQQLDLKLDVKEAPAIPQYSGKKQLSVGQSSFLNSLFNRSQNIGTSASLKKNIKNRKKTIANSRLIQKFPMRMINKLKSSRLKAQVLLH